MPATAMNNTFEYLPISGRKIIQGEKKSLDDLMLEEEGSDYIIRFSGLKSTVKQRELADLVISEYSGEEAINTDFLAGLIGYTNQFFGHKTRDLGKKPYMMHFITSARLAAVMGLNPRVIYGYIIHDIAEEIIDSILESKYSNKLDSLISMKNAPFGKMILDLENNFKKVEGTDKHTLNPHQRQYYMELRFKVLRTVYKDLLEIAEKSSENIKTAKDIVYIQNAVTRDNARSYEFDMQKILEDKIYTLTKKYIIKDSKRTKNFDQELKETLSYIRLDALAVKCLDGLHNLRTQKAVEIPGSDISLEGKEKPPEIMSIDHQVASLSKRLGIIDATREHLLKNLDTSDKSSYKLDKKLEGIYLLHLLLADQASVHANYLLKEFLKVYGRVQNKFHEDYYACVASTRNALKEYEKIGLMDGITNQNSHKEIEFKKRFGYSFGGTIRRLTNHASKIKLNSLYHDFAHQKDIFKFVDDTLALGRVFERYLSINYWRHYKKGLRDYHLQRYITQ